MVKKISSITSAHEIICKLLNMIEKQSNKYTRLINEKSKLEKLLRDTRANQSTTIINKTVYEPQISYNKICKQAQYGFVCGIGFCAIMAIFIYFLR